MAKPAFTEAESCVRAMYFAEHLGAQIYIPHLSTRMALDEVRKWRCRYDKVFVETCPHYLLFDDSVYNSDSLEIAKYVMTPPLRTPDDQKHLWRALRYDDLQVIATDHCPFCMKEQKELGIGDFSKIPNGIGSVEHRMDLLYQGVVDGRISRDEATPLAR